MREKLKGHQDIGEALLIMSEGNPGAVSVLTKLLEGGMNDLMVILDLDDMNIRGEQIWLGYKDFANCDLEVFKKAARNRSLEMVQKINAEMSYSPTKELAVTGGASFKRQ